MFLWILVPVICICQVSYSQTSRKNPEFNFQNDNRASWITTVSMASGGLSATALAQGILPAGTAVFNVTSNIDEGIGAFMGGFDANFGINKGIILGSGCVTNVSYIECIWPNGPGDAGLNALGTGYSTYDAAVLEFDFIPDQNQIIFDFIFGSNDYMDFDDVCAIFLDGVNIALLPSGQEISVRTLEFTPNFIHNDGTVLVAVDDYTPLFQAVANVTPGNTHHLKIAIADDGDNGVDSYLFIKGNVNLQVPLSPIAWILGAGLIILFAIIRFRRAS